MTKPEQARASFWWFAGSAIAVAALVAPLQWALCSLKESEVIALAALVIALLAMVATFWQAHVARQHARVSVRPHLDWSRELHPNKPTDLRIMNNGLGPAEVISVRFFLDGQEVPFNGFELPAQINATLGGFPHTEVKIVTTGTPIAPNNEIKIIDAKEVNHMIAPLVRRVGFVIEYKSFYGERFILDVKKQP